VNAENTLDESEVCESFVEVVAASICINC